MITEKCDRFGKLIEENLKYVQSGEGATVKMMPQLPLCADDSKSFRSLCRFDLLDWGITTVGRGYITEVVYKE